MAGSTEKRLLRLRLKPDHVYAMEEVVTRRWMRSVDRGAQPASRYNTSTKDYCKCAKHDDWEDSWCGSNWGADYGWCYTGIDEEDYEMQALTAAPTSACCAHFFVCCRAGCRHAWHTPTGR